MVFDPLMFSTFMAFLKEKIEIGIEQAELNAQNTFLGFSKGVKLYIVIMAITIIPVYFVSKIAAEKIWLAKNSANAIAAKASFVNALAPQISEVNVLNIGNGFYAAVVEIRNKNFDLSFHNTAYKFTFYNSAQQQVYESSGTTFLLPSQLLPSQAKYVALARFPSQEPVAFAEFKLEDNIRWQKRLAIEDIKIVSPKPRYFEQLSPPAFVAEGDFVNESSYYLRQVRLIFLVRDFNDKIIAMDQRDEGNVRPSQRRAYKQIWPNLSGNLVKSVEVFVETNPFDPNNLQTQ